MEISGWRSLQFCFLLYNVLVGFGVFGVWSFSICGVDSHIFGTRELHFFQGMVQARNEKNNYTDNNLVGFASTVNNIFCHHHISVGYEGKEERIYLEVLLYCYLYC